MSQVNADRSAALRAPNNSVNSTLNNSKPSPVGAGKQSSSGEYTTEGEEEEMEEEEGEDEDEWETETESDRGPLSPGVIQSKLPKPKPATAVANVTTKKQLSESSVLTDEEDEDEYTEEESEADSHGALWDLVSNALCRYAFVSVMQRMFGTDPVAKSVVARDLVALTSPTKHGLIVLRNAVKAELARENRFDAQGSFFQDVLFHTLVRVGASFFREALSPTVKTLSGITQDFDIGPDVGPSKLDQNQNELRKIADALFDELFSDKAKRNVPRLLRCALWVAKDEANSIPGGASFITGFVASSILARLLSDPVGSKMTPAISKVALANLGRIAKVTTGISTPDPSIGPFFGAWCTKQSARLSEWVEEMSKDPTGAQWKTELSALPSFPQKERDMVSRLSIELKNLKQWLISIPKDRLQVATTEEKTLLEQILGILRTFDLEGGGSLTEPMRSVRNPHRKVPHDVLLLQKEIIGLENFSLGGNLRRLVSQGPVVARKKSREEDGHLLLFTDILLYCKHNSPEDEKLFTFSRAYRLHQVVVRPLLDAERAAAAAFCVSAFGMPAHHDLTFFAANARDKERWVELIRKKQTELRANLLKNARKFPVNELVKNNRSIPVELALTQSAFMKVVPQTDNINASYDLDQLRELRKMDSDTLVFDFSAAMDDTVEDLILRVRSDRADELLAEVNQLSNSRQLSQRGEKSNLPSFRLKNGESSGRKPVIVTAPVENVPATARATSPRPETPKTAPTDPKSPRPVQVATLVPQASGDLRQPPRQFSPRPGGEMEQVIVNKPGEIPDRQIIKDRKGNERDAWDAEKGANVKRRERDEARLRRQREKEKRAQQRAQGSRDRNRRLDEDKKLFLVALEKSLERLVVVPDESALRRPEELTDREVLKLQKRAYRWKRENRLLKEMLYTQYVVSNNPERMMQDVVQQQQQQQRKE